MNIFSRRRGAAVTLAALLVIGYLTLTPSPVDPYAAEAPWWCLWCGKFGLVDTLANIALFVPLGIGFRLLGLSPAQAALAALAVTGGIEGLQFKTISGRDANLRDLVTNSLGAMLGFGLVPVARPLLRPSPRVAARLGLAVALTWVTSRVVTGILLAPSPPDGIWFAQLAPQYVYSANLDGAVRDPFVNARSVRIGTLARIEEFVGPWRRDSLWIQARVELRSLPPRLASVVSVLTERREEAFVLGLRGGDAVLRTRTRATDVSLRSPMLRLREVARAGDTLTLVGGREGRALRLRSAGAVERSTEVPLSAGLGWALLSPFDIALEPRSAWWSAAVVFIASALLAWYFGLAFVPAVALMLAGAAGLGAMVVPPLLTLAAAAPAPEWLGLGVGLLAVFVARVAQPRGQGSRESQ